MEFEKNIPITKKYKDDFSEMQVGNSLFFKYNAETKHNEIVSKEKFQIRILSKFTRFKKWSGKKWKFTSRQVFGGFNICIGVRVWRIK